MERLLEKGCTTNPKDSSGQTPLFRAALNQKWDIVVLLLVNHAGFDFDDPAQLPWIQMFIKSGHYGVLTAIAKHLDNESKEELRSFSSRRHSDSGYSTGHESVESRSLSSSHSSKEDLRKV